MEDLPIPFIWLMILTLLVMTTLNALVLSAVYIRGKQIKSKSGDGLGIFIYGMGLAEKTDNQLKSFKKILLVYATGSMGFAAIITVLGLVQIGFGEVFIGQVLIWAATLIFMAGVNVGFLYVFLNR